MALSNHPKAEKVLAQLENGPKDKHEIAAELNTTASTAKDHISTLRDLGYTVDWDHSLRKYHLGGEVERSLESISTDEAVTHLESGITTAELADELHTTEDTITSLCNQIEEQGYTLKQTGDTLYIPDERDRKFAIDSGTSLTFALISDTHLGSEAEHLAELKDFYDRVQDRGIEHVFHCGDISDGWKVHPGHLNEIKGEAAGWERLKSYVLENYPQRDGVTTHFIEGNHDNKFYNRNNLHFGRVLANEREDLHYCGNAQATFELGEGVDLEMIHPSGGKPYTTDYRLQTLYRERNMEKKPTIAGVGHIHGSMYAETEGVKGFYAGCWKGITTYGKRKGFEAKIGGWIINTEMKDGEVRKLIPEWIGYDERGTASSHKL